MNHIFFSVVGLGILIGGAAEVSDFKACGHCTTEVELIRFVKEEAISETGAKTILLAAPSIETVYVVRYAVSNDEASAEKKVEISSIEKADEDTQIQFIMMMRAMKKARSATPAEND